jgi:hypothetical protein
MTNRSSRRPKVTWWRLALGAAGLAALAAAVFWGRQVLLPRAEAAPPETASAPVSPDTPPAVPPETTEYSRRVVAFLNGTTPITRAQLGEFLIARFGAEKVHHLVNMRIIEKACADSGVGATEAEINAVLAEDLASLKVNQKEFVGTVLKRYHKTLYEWRQDVLRPKLLMTKLLRDRVRVEEEEVRKAFETAYGEKVQCQAIMWPLDQQQKVHDLYDTLLKKPEEFDRLARTQEPNRRLAAVGGMLEPFGRHGMGDAEVEKAAFSLREGEITPILKTTTPNGQYCTILKLIRRVPPQANARLPEVRPALEREILERKIQVLIPAECEKIRQAAAPKVLLTAAQAEAGEAIGRAGEPVAFIHGNVPITREELGEYLIARRGTDAVDLLVNKLVVERACAAKGIKVTQAEIDLALNQHLASLNLDRKGFEENVLRPNRKTLYEWREDCLRPGLLMNRLIRDTIRVEEEDLRKCFEAHYGEKVECRLILWPRTPRDHEIAIKQYEAIRKSTDEFDRAARTQASARLAAEGGRIPHFGRWSTGNETMEREVFKLREGEITPLIETPEGYAVFKLMRRIPPDKTRKLEDVRANLEKEILEKKTQQQIPIEFQKLRSAAEPNVLLHSTMREDDLMNQVKQELGASGRKAIPPQGN